MKKGFTLIEIILVIAISGILAVGTFKALGALYTRSAEAKAATKMSIRSQIVLDQLSYMLYDRIPQSVIGYDGSSSCKALSDITSSGYVVLEWLENDISDYRAKKFSGFVDMKKSTKPNLDTNISSSISDDDKNLIFSGAFDYGDEAIKACEGAFGWHGHDSNLSYDINITQNNIEINDTVKKPDYIYEKYFLTDGAYAVARGKDIDTSATCIQNLNISSKDIDDTLFLFYGYHPWKGKTYCADKSGNGEGNASILTQHVKGFEAEMVDFTIRISIDMQKNVGGKIVHISKQKVVF